MSKILIVEDDLNLGTSLASMLEMQEHRVLYLSDGETAVAESESFQPDIVLLDIMLNNDMDGFDIAREIRTKSNTPIIFITSREGNEDFRTGFGIDNTDYIRKPFKMMEVIVRINSMLDRQHKTIVYDNAYHIGNLAFFPGEQSLSISREKIRLTNYETAVLALLCKNIGHFVSRKDIITHVWKENDHKQKEGSLNNIVSNLRKYIEKDADQVELETRFKLGVRIVLKS
jgi:DNA-binding response OmpR family regulator